MGQLALASRYETVFGTEIELTVGSLRLHEDLRHWVNDGLMTLFSLRPGPFLAEVAAEQIVDALELEPDLQAADVRGVSFLIRESVPLTERLEHLLHPWTSYVVIPVFALANAGVARTAAPRPSRPRSGSWWRQRLRQRWAPPC